MRDRTFAVVGSGAATLSEQPLTLFDCMNALMIASICGLICSKLTTRAVAVAVGGTGVAVGTAVGAAEGLAVRAALPEGPPVATRARVATLAGTLPPQALRVAS